MDFTLTQGPAFTLTRDGTLISPGAVPAIFPGPLASPFFSSQVTPGELEQLQDMIEAIGLPEMTNEKDDDATSTVADATTAMVTYWDSEGAHIYSVYALGVFDAAKPATRATEDLIDILTTLAGRDATAWPGDQVQVVAIPGAIDPGFTDEREWPLEEGVETWEEVFDMRCAVLDATVLDSFADANQATTFPSPEPEWAEVFRLAIRPLHPGETGCEVPS